jgi:hypothetical protein
VGVDQGIKKPNAVVANSQWKEAADACLVGCARTLQCALEADLRFDDVLEADAHHITKVFCCAVLSLGGQRGEGYG